MGVLILGTDFRHAVEFSRSGRAENQTLAGPRLQLVLSCSAPRPGLAVVPGAKRKLRGWESGVKRVVGDARHLIATGPSRAVHMRQNRRSGVRGVHANHRAASLAYGQPP